jgi:hypothetical protein
MKSLIILLSVLLLLGGAFPLATAADAARRLQHVVSFKFKADAQPKRIQELERAFAGLKSKITEIVAFEWGVNNSPEGKNKGFTHCFVLAFRTEKDRDAYLVHPAHQEFVTLVRGVVEDVFVIDYWAQ